MQQQFAPAENTTPTGTSYRVTPQEFAQAVSALESRREAEHRQQAETIPIADAVQHLGLNASEGEVLAEVEAMRREQAQRERQAALTQARKRATRLMLLPLVGAAAVLVIIPLAVYNMHLRHKLDLATQAFTPLPMQLLSQVPSGVVVHVDDVSLKALASGTVTAGKVSVDTRHETSGTTDTTLAPMFNNEWTLLKSGQNVMVRAWATADQALRVSNNEAGAVFSNRPPWLAAANVVLVQLPLYRFASMRGFGYNARGEQGNGVNNVLQAVDIETTDETVSAIVKNYLNDKQPGDGPPHYSDGLVDYDEINTQDNGTHVRLTGDVNDTVMLQRQTALANEILHQAGVPATVINEMHVKAAH